MRGLRGFLTGALALIALEVVVSSKQATGRVSGIFTGIAAATSWLLDSNTPAIPDRAHPASTTSTTVTPALAATPAQLVAPPPIGQKTPAYASSNPVILT